jgi:hypothetical protein
VNRALLTAAAIAAAIALAGCSSNTPAQQQAATPTSTHPVLGAGDVVTEDDDMLIDPEASEAVPMWTDESRVAALDLAARAIEAWARPDLPYEQWWAGLAGYLTPGAREVVALTDPANIPVTSVAGVELPDEGDTAYVGWISADTNDGTWWVLVAWQADGTWLVDRITQSREVAP